NKFESVAIVAGALGKDGNPAPLGQWAATGQLRLKVDAARFASPPIQTIIVPQDQVVDLPGYSRHPRRPFWRRNDRTTARLDVVQLDGRNPNDTLRTAFQVLRTSPAAVARRRPAKLLFAACLAALAFLVALSLENYITRPARMRDLVRTIRDEE